MLAIFTDYALWLRGILSRHGIEPRHLIDNVREIDAALQQTPELSAELREGCGLLLDTAVNRLQQLERRPGRKLMKRTKRKRTSGPVFLLF